MGGGGLRRQHRNAPAGPDRQGHQLAGGGEPGRLVVGVGGQDVGGDDGVGLLEHGRGHEVLAVEVEGQQRAAGVEVVREGEGQAELPGQLGAVVAGAEQHDRGRVSGGRRGRKAVPHAVGATRVAEQPHQVNQVARELLGAQAGRGTAEGGGGAGVGAGGTAYPEIDPAGVERLEHGELFGHDQGG